MDATSSLTWFVVAAVLANVVIYGGITLAYFTYKRQGARSQTPARNGSATAGRVRSAAPSRGLRDAA